MVASVWLPGGTGKRLEAIERRLGELEGAELELEELRRTATNAVRSLRRAAANALQAPPSPDAGNGKGTVTPLPTAHDLMARRRFP